jgi:hypothetical protein
VKIELVVVSGAEGRYLRQKQDDAIRSRCDGLRRTDLRTLVSGADRRRAPGRC